jgi:hypothetical protein
MRAGHFLHCRDCEVLFRPSPHDRAPEFCLTADGYHETVRDDCMEFLTRHARHRLETLRPTSAQVFHTGALWDPAASTYWEVSNGTQVAVVEGRRTDVGSALRYRLRAGRVVAERDAVEVSDDGIRQEVDRALYPGVAPERKLRAFVEAFKEVVWSLDPATFECAYDVPGDPTLSMASLPATAVATLSTHARRIFDEADSEKLVARLRTSADDCDAFTVLLRQRVRIDG